MEPKLKDMKKAAQIGEVVFRRMRILIEPGVTTASLNHAAKKTIEYNDAIPEFLGYGKPPFPTEVCVSLNEEICHGVPGERKLGGGDLVSIDVGIRVNDHLVDACRTFRVGEVSEEADHLDFWTQTALKRAVRHVKAGKHWNDIARIIENTARNKTIGIIKAMNGHGVGANLHEPPLLRNYVCDENEGIILEEGQTICIEPMFSLGTDECEIAENGWTVITKDRSLSSHWEHCIMVTATGCEVLL